VVSRLKYAASIVYVSGKLIEHFNNISKYICHPQNK